MIINYLYKSLTEYCEFVFSLYSENKEQFFTDTLKLKDLGVDFSIDKTKFEDILTRTSATQSGFWMYTGQNIRFTIIAEETDFFQVHIINSPNIWGKDGDFYILDAKTMPRNPIFSFDIFPSEPLAVHRGGHSISTLDLGFSPFTYTAGENKSPQTLKVYIRNSANNIKTMDWTFSFKK